MFFFLKSLFHYIEHIWFLNGKQFLDQLKFRFKIENKLKLDTIWPVEQNDLQNGKNIII